MIPTLHFPEQCSREQFLDQYWQRKPLLMRGAIDPALLQFDPGELAGMACEDGIESRLIRQLGDTDWQLQHGPLEETAFSELPESDWTLLVQDVDKHVPEVADVLDAFDFLPDWRIDDIMISFAADQGGVGPHTDNYDVFLIQAQGTRRWRLSERIYQDDDLLDDCPLRVLREFDTDYDWELHPGDVLYLPPRMAHWGTAVGECMTWSVGMRGPSDSELASAWLESVTLDRPRRYFRDSLESSRASDCHISHDEFATAARLISALSPHDSPEFRRWFACYVTEPKPDLEIEAPSETLSAGQLRQAVDNATGLRRHPWARFASIRLEDDAIGLCSQGQCFELAREHAELLSLVCRHRRLAADTLRAQPEQAALWEWLSQLFNRGLLILDD